MNDLNQLDDVIFRFHREVEVPTPEIVAAWTREHPDFAVEIRAHAIEMVDMQFWAELDTARSTVADGSTAPIASADRQSLREAAAAAGLSLPDLARQLDIARSLVADVSTGRIVASSVPVRFIRSVAQRLGRTAEDVATRILGTADTAPAASFKAASGPTDGRPATWEEAVRSSGMSEERQAFWLSKGE